MQPGTSRGTFLPHPEVLPFLYQGMYVKWHALPSGTSTEARGQLPASICVLAAAGGLAVVALDAFCAVLASRTTKVLSTGRSHTTVLSVYLCAGD